MIDRTHDPELKSWVESANAPDTDFPIQNLPYGTFRLDKAIHLGVAIGDQILDITKLYGIASMHNVMEMLSESRVQLRQRISNFLERRTLDAEDFLIPITDVEMLLPCRIGDYTDFYCSLHHATNVGRMFRPDNPLFPNYKWLPVAYHGRSSSVVVSGMPIHRPSGQIVDKPGGQPVYAPSKKLDYELELGAFLGPGNAMGDPIPIGQAEEHLFGVCLLNDWSARDIQAWEYQPLGPFLAKNFATSISLWVVTREALTPFRCAVPARPEGDPEPLPHLTTSEGSYNITLEVWLNTRRLSRVNFSTQYWTLGQMIAHHTSNGCPIRAGDLLGSGTVSGPDPDSRGCLLEQVGTGGRFLQDGDEVILRGWCEAPGYRRIGLGECLGRIC